MDRETLIDLSVPPIPADEEARFTDEETGDFLGCEFAKYACAQSGSVGGIGLALGILSDVAAEFDSIAEMGARPDEMAFYAETLHEICEILTVTAATEIDTVDEPLYGDKEGTTSRDSEGSLEDDSERETETQPIPESARINPQHLIPVTVDRVSNSGNVLGVSDELNPDFIHLTHGTVGEEVLAYVPDEAVPDLSSGNKQATLFHTQDPQEVVENYCATDECVLQPGDLLKIFKPILSTDDSTVVEIEGYNVATLQLNEKISGKKDLVVSVTEVLPESARATIKKQVTRTKRKRKKSKSNFSFKNSKGGKYTTTIRQRKEKYTDRGSGNPFKSSKNLNELLKGKQ